MNKWVDFWDTNGKPEISIVDVGLKKLLDIYDNKPPKKYGGMKKTKIYSIRPYNWNYDFESNECSIIDSNDRPHFIFHPSKLNLRWYKYPLRGAETQTLETPAVWIKAVYECLKKEKIVEEVMDDIIQSLDSCSYCNDSLWACTSQSLRGIGKEYSLHVCHKHMNLDSNHIHYEGKGPIYYCGLSFFVCLKCGDVWFSRNGNDRLERVCKNCGWIDKERLPNTIIPLNKNNGVRLRELGRDKCLEDYEIKRLRKQVDWRFKK